MEDKTASVSLPEILSVFPLTGVLLLPGTRLPLHIFEPRYRNLVHDALEAEGVFGMIQPFTPQRDNRPQPGAEQTIPDLYPVGCAGHIERWEQSPDGRYMVQLRGISRFRVKEELSVERGYRRVLPDYASFADLDGDASEAVDRPRLTQALSRYAEARGMAVDPDQLHPIPDADFVNFLGVAMPFHPSEKQALLEAGSFKERQDLLVNLLEFGGGAPEPPSGSGSRTLN
ncbi:MAG: LON peptidase substrate-binding domain-containing protein [Deltaproteobacteria bacterium]|nr:LON peptidase substrate-binding domain-containing protein [Deltaproteobacteria bacterium]